VASADLEPGVPGLLDHLAASEADRLTASGETELIRNRLAFKIFELFRRLPVRRPGTSRDRVCERAGRDAHLLTLCADLAARQHGG
jgi:hypothetical protein